jgi:omega-6 fatty acid desaturase (delta-12 desaturase)
MTAQTAPFEPDGGWSKDAYDAIRARLEFRPNPWLNVLTIGVNLALLGAALRLLSLHSTLGYWLAQLMLPVVFFQAFSLLHDCGHGSCTASRIGNTVIGHYASALCFMPFFPWKYVHTQHHVWAGDVDHDPGLALVRRARDTGKLPWLVTGTWRTWLPIVGLVQHVVYWSYPIVAFRTRKLSADKAVRCAFSVLFLLVLYVGLNHFAANVINFRNFAPGIVLYLALVELVNIPHHVGLTSFQERLPLWRQHLPTRSCNYPIVISELLVLNFNFHIEHHLFPKLPWYRLRRARRLLKPALGAAYREVHGVQWQLQARRQHLVDVLAVTQGR